MATITSTLEPKAHKQNPHIGLPAKYCSEMSAELSTLLASTYQLLIKSHVFHWNVVGPLFKPIHELLEDHYNELFKATDTIAERIRTLGQLAPVKFRDISDFAPKPVDVNQLSANAMITDLIDDHQQAVKNLREVSILAGKSDDKVTEDMLTARLTFHEKALWMLGALVTQ